MRLLAEPARYYYIFQRVLENRWHSLQRTRDLISFVGMEENAEEMRSTVLYDLVWRFGMSRRSQSWSPAIDGTASVRNEARSVVT